MFAVPGTLSFIVGIRLEPVSDEGSPELEELDMTGEAYSISSGDTCADVGTSQSGTAEVEENILFGIRATLGTL